MSVEWLLDTNIVIGLPKGSTPVVERMVHLQITLDRVAVNQITKLELLSSLSRSISGSKHRSQR